jgi:hypothetical protein
MKLYWLPAMQVMYKIVLVNFNFLFFSFFSFFRMEFCFYNLKNEAKSPIFLFLCFCNIFTRSQKDIWINRSSNI